MSRMTRFAMILTIVAVFAAGAVAILRCNALAQTQTQTVRRLPSLPRSAATAPPLPLTAPAVGSPSASLELPDLARLYASARPSGMTRWNAPPLPGRMPKLSAALKKLAGKRHASSATGASVVLTGGLGQVYLNDQTEPYGEYIGWLCQNMAPNAYYKYVLFAPDGTTYSPAISFSPQFSDNQVLLTTATGQCNHGIGNWSYAAVNLWTPPATGTDPAYSGVWAVGMLRGTWGGGVFTPIAYDSVVYTVVIATLNFATYSDAAYSVPQVQFQPTQTMYFSANGLTPSHQYAFGVVFTGGSGLPCEFTFPAAAQNWAAGASCFTGGVPTGITPFGGVVQGSWNIPAVAPTGTYSVELYDVTTSDLVSEQQISVSPATSTITLTPINGVTPGTNINNTFATDGYLMVNGVQTAEQSVSGVNLSINPTIAGHTYSLVQSTPNGVVLTQTVANSQSFGPAQTFTAVGATSTPTFNWPLIAAPYSTAIGPVLTSFAPNVNTLQVYDNTAGTILGSQSFKILAYNAAMQWTAPAATSETVTVSPVFTPETVAVSNTAGALYGTWNGDGISKIVLAPDAANNIVLALNGASAIDSSSQTWNFALVGGTLVATPAIVGQYLPVGGTLNIPVKVAVAVLGQCKTTYCTLRTAITPYHGIAQSAYDIATNGLIVFGPGGSPSTGSATFAWQAWAGAAPGTLPANPRFTQMLYQQGTENVTTGNYTVVMNAVNCGTTENIQELEFTLPAQINVNEASATPVLTSVKVNGVAQNWTLYVTTSGAGHGSGNLSQNQFAIGYTGPGNNAVNGGGIPFGTSVQCGVSKAPYTAVITLNWPMPALSFQPQDIPVTADYQGGCLSNACGMAAFNLVPLSQLTNSVAGYTNVDSTELGFFSLNPTLMTGVYNPGTVSQGVPTSSVFQFTNTPVASDPSPDYVDELVLDVPAALLPNSITPPANWFLNSTGPDGSGGTNYFFSVCNAGLPPCGVAGPLYPGGNEPNALAPGNQIGFTFNWTVAHLPAVGTYNMIWKAYGANGGAFTKPASVATVTAPIVFANTTAQVSFLDAGDGDGTPAGAMTPVIGGSQATIGSDYDPIFGNGFVLQLFNNGSQTIISANITVPATDVLSAKPVDATHDWQVANVYVYPGSGGAGCNGVVPLANITQPIDASGTAGSIKLTGCTLAPGATLKLFFTSQAPYDQPNHYYRFNGTVSSAITPNAPTQTAYVNSDTILVISDAQLHIYIPTGATISNGLGLGGTDAVTCAGCTYVPSPQTINFGTIAGTFTTTDVINAAVASDTQAAHGWKLYVDVNALPTGGTLVTEVDNTAGIRSASPYYTNNLPAYTALTTASPGTLLSSFTGQTAVASYSHTPVQNLMNFQVQLPAFPVPLTPGANSVTLTYTLIPN